MPIVRHKMLLVAAVLVLAAGFAVPISKLPDLGSGLWSGLVLEVQTVQRDLHRQLAAAL